MNPLKDLLESDKGKEEIAKRVLDAMTEIKETQTEGEVYEHNWWMDSGSA